ncbi:tetratricopeptide repeat protein [Planctomycetes bacterium K23_9]|uniref:Tetratricopeptide repeat protein n=1 Tax=Stieleria marina TaxID=1930275 RepID=A0A517NU15_9BACT|nr:Tetratricopeptide repeat protein [Planctomycetes bacterium K23_9]
MTTSSSSSLPSSNLLSNDPPEAADSAARTGERSAAEPTASVAQSWTWYLLGLLFLIAVAWWLYARSLDYDLIFDDLPTIVGNESIHQLFPLFGDEGSFGPLNPKPSTPVTARPLVSLAFAVNYHFGGENPWGYRLFHIALHVATAALLWAIVAFTLKQPRLVERFGSIRHAIAFVAALLWMVHPCHSETLIYLTQRTELMMGFFYLLTIYLSLLYWQSNSLVGRTIWLILATVACTSGMMCKEMMASVPAMVLLYEWTFMPGTTRDHIKRSWPLYVGLALSWIPIAWLYTSGYTTPLAGFNNTISAVDWWMTQANAFFVYWKMTFVPYPLVLHHQVPTLTSMSEAWPGVLGLVIYGAVTAWLLIKRRASGYVLIWFFAVLSPTLIVPLPLEEISDRRLYVPLAAVTPLLVALVFGWWGKFTDVARDSFPSRPIAAAGKLLSNYWVPVGVFAITIFVSSMVTARTMPRLSSRQIVWKEVLKHEPDNMYAMMCQGCVEFNDGDHEQGLAKMRRSFEARPDMKMGVISYATALENRGYRKRIIDVYREAIRVSPTEPMLRYNLAFWLEQSGKTGQAIEAYQACLEYAPQDAAAHTNLGSLLAEMGQLPAAIEHFEAAVKIEPDFSSCMNLMTAYLQNGQSEQAAVAAEKLLVAARSEGKHDVANRIERSLVALKAKSR